jgi:AraC-like DNA-binding protein
MSIYTTPLQFGYFLGLLFALLFWLRSWNEERLSDRLLGFVLFFLAMEIQDYTFGFAGINILWEELNGFPRYFHLVFAPTIYFYLKAQINHEFQLKKQHFIHYLPYLVYFLVNISIFFQGEKTVLAFQKSELSYWLSWLEKIAIWNSYGYYFYQSLKLYKTYRNWTETQFSDTETIGFIWLRNFIYLIIAGEIFRLIWHGIDILLGDLPFEQDWWWHLFTVGIIAYVAIKGYTQAQPKKLVFRNNTLQNEEIFKTEKAENNTHYLEWKPKIERLLFEEKIFLQPDLSLADMATKLRTNASVLSAAINQNFNKNFNDFVNEYRVEEFRQQLHLPENKHLTLLAIAFDCGFNSKATFNRAVKKVTGLSPKEL